MAITGIEYRYLYAENNQTKRQISSTTKNTGTEGTTAAETTKSVAVTTAAAQEQKDNDPTASVVI